MNTINLINVAQSEWEKVEVQSNAVFKIDYYNYYANYWYCVALIRQQKYDQAAKTADKMLAIFPTNVVFLNVLAESKFLKGEKEEALKIFESVIVLDKENETAKHYLKDKRWIIGGKMKTSEHADRTEKLVGQGPRTSING
jgi:tetratricopeptide (TPR) repeat protein